MSILVMVNFSSIQFESNMFSEAQSCKKYMIFVD